MAAWVGIYTRCPLTVLDTIIFAALWLLTLLLYPLKMFYPCEFPSYCFQWLTPLRCLMCRQLSNYINIASVGTLPVFRPGLPKPRNLCHWLALVIYEHVTTIDKELSLIWHRKWTCATAIFLVNRYSLLLVNLSALVTPPSAEVKPRPGCLTCY